MVTYVHDSPDRVSRTSSLPGLQAVHGGCHDAYEPLWERRQRSRRLMDRTDGLDRALYKACSLVHLFTSSITESLNRLPVIIAHSLFFSSGDRHPSWKVRLHELDLG